MEKYIEVAAHWWADKLRHPTLDSFDMGYEIKMPEESFETGLLLAQQNPDNMKKIDLFEKRLAEWISAEMEEFDVVYLVCDYHPGGSLYTISVECDLSQNLFPQKTSMTIRKNKVTVKCGYGTTEETLFPVT